MVSHPPKPKKLRRREFLQVAGRVIPFGLVAAAIPSIALKALASETPPDLYGEPDLLEANILRFTAGLRPHRSAGIRIVAEQRFNKTLIHNYGHSGAGFTLAWGSAAAACKLVPANVRRGEHIAVIGAGIVGLATAHELRERGFHVTVYAEKFFPEVTSSIAGGQWSPALVPRGQTPEQQAFFNSLLEYSFVKYRVFAGHRYGVLMRDNVIVDGSHDALQDITFPSMPPGRRVDPLPFEGMNVAGIIQPSWMIEPPIFLPQLMHRMIAMGITFKRQTFQMDDVNGTISASIAGLRERIVFNCMGLGAKRLVCDDTLFPIRGRLIHLNPDPSLRYLLLMKGYMFPRRDAVILGGAFDKYHADLPFDQTAYETILNYHRTFFGQPTAPFQRTDVPYIAVEG